MKYHPVDDFVPHFKVVLSVFKGESVIKFPIKYNIIRLVDTLGAKSCCAPWSKLYPLDDDLEVAKL